MPPLRGLLGQMIVSFYPPGGPTLDGFANWEQMGRWYQGLTNGRFDSSPEIKQKVNTLRAQPIATRQDACPGTIGSTRHPLRRH